ncbi:Bestrophin, RFP-TM, chloride channel [Lignipirellula cremea]|uniref:Bestrophin, RFP-TM, chloride channel n=1 Tax=Lignipirellula cremea TaxID=2528010 RepID=A0A518DX56_9BACT|nr:hypothetical protein [Lignipirellula cremea]QDU96415.1 Bestrophin, RFP-TM, chloride channel [Lignipirellula cremea]
MLLLVAYPLLLLDQIGIELQNPFSLDRWGRLPLNEISTNIERNILDAAGLPAQTDPSERETVPEAATWLVSDPVAPQYAAD